MDKLAIIMMDMWDGYLPQHNFMLDLIEQYICKTAFLLDNTLGNPNMPAVLCCYPNRFIKAHNALKHRCQFNNRRDNSNRIVSFDLDNVLSFLKKQSVTTLCYAGFSLPGCVEARPLGLEAMSEHFKIKIIADCALDLFNAHHNQYDRINELYRYMQKKNYEYTFTTDIIADYK